MPDLEEADFIENCVVYSLSGRDRQGEPIVAFPVQYSCRWVDTSMLKTKGGQGGGDPVTYDAQVAVGVSDTEIPVGSLMWCGQLSQVPGTADPPEPTSDIFIVVRAKSAKDVMGVRRRTELMLNRFRGTMPTILNAGA